MLSDVKEGVRLYYKSKIDRADHDIRSLDLDKKENAKAVAVKKERCEVWLKDIDDSRELQVKLV